MKGAGKSNMRDDQSSSRAVVAIVVVVLLATIAAGVYYAAQENRKDSPSTKTATPASSSGSESEQKVTTSGNYKNGTYTATGSYISPGGQEEIEVSVTLKGGVVDSTSVAAKAASGTSRQYQGEFIDGYKDMVVGKSIDEVELSRVAGSSLTSSGFNDALEEIRQKAAL